MKIYKIAQLDPSVREDMLLFPKQGMALNYCKVVNWDRSRIPGDIYILGIEGLSRCLQYINTAPNTLIEFNVVLNKLSISDCDKIIRTIFIDNYCMSNNIFNYLKHPKLTKEMIEGFPDILINKIKKDYKCFELYKIVCDGFGIPIQ